MYEAERRIRVDMERLEVRRTGRGWGRDGRMEGGLYSDVTNNGDLRSSPPFAVVGTGGSG